MLLVYRRSHSRLVPIPRQVYRELIMVQYLRTVTQKQASGANLSSALTSIGDFRQAFPSLQYGNDNTDLPYRAVVRITTE